MNRLNFDQTGGFPLKVERLQELQDIMEMFNALGHIAGDKSIISGCQVTGSETRNGTVFLNGEVLEFVGGTTQNTVVIVEETKQREFYTGDVKPVHLRRYLTFGSGQNSIEWSGFNKITQLLELQGRILPPGTNPQLYCGSVEDIPPGWQLCDGSNNTHDLRHQFIVGYDPRDPDYDQIGKTGGEKKHSLTEQELPAHKHSASAANSGSHRHGLSQLKNNTNNNHYDGLYDRSVNGTPSNLRTDSAGEHSHVITVENTGGNEAHENRPPYYTLAYIIYTGQ